ncbi:MAG TPA: heparan-alpha-glucosaminide N-acetyltransferase domain-containing protein [Gammaproteobacteria bacterium]
MSAAANRPVDSRLASIDMLRGLVIVIMALDHVRDMVTVPLPGLVDFSQAPPALFFTRFITHLCAPTFIFLAGTSAFLYGAGKRTRAEVARFLLIRGLWLVFIEITVVNLAWNFNLGGQFTLMLQVIWAIGISMIALAALLWLPRVPLAILSIAMIAGHNLLDGIQPSPAEASLLWMFLHIQAPIMSGDRMIAIIGYPVIPWIGVMALGYCAGPVFRGSDPGRPRRLILAGFAVAAAFVLVRLTGVYGDPDGWQAQDSLLRTVIDFLNTTKYPPSLLYLLMTLGPAAILLGLFETWRGRVADALVLIGRVPFFFYVAHLYVIHALGIAVGLWQGFPVEKIAVIFFWLPEGFGVSLGFVYLFWAAVVLALYPACRWFAGVKARRRDWWLSYL